jgi:putative DNA primase/helicase
MTLKLVDLNDHRARDLNSVTLGEPTEADCDTQAINRDRVAELAGLSRLEYDRQRLTAAKELGIRASTLDDAVNAIKGPRKPETTVNEPSIFPDREPWPDPVPDIGAVLEQASNLILRYMAMDRHWGHVTALWCLYTYLVHCFSVSPRYAAQSPTPECGKSTLLNLIFSLARKPLKTANIQLAGIFRIVELYDPTLIIDEGDAFLHDNEPLRGILNSGHASGDLVVRIEGEPLMPRTYKVFGAAAFGSIKALPGTVQSRCIVNPLRRATKAEASGKKQFRQDAPPAEAKMIAAQFQRWATDNADRLKGAEPDMRGLFNRQADNWRPLFAIASIVGGDWPTLIQNAALKITGIVDEQPINVELLIDVRRIFCPPGHGANGIEFIGSEPLRDMLAKLDGGSRPWADWKARGKPLSAMALATMLKEFGIHPRHSPTGGARGYYLSEMHDAFGRYLPPQGVKPSEDQQNRAELPAFKPSNKVSSDTFKPSEEKLSDTLKPSEYGSSDTLNAASNADAKRVSDTLTPWEGEKGDPADWSAACLEAEMAPRATRQTVTTSKSLNSSIGGCRDEWSPGEF